MTQSQARRNLISRQNGEHCHDYAQLMFGWRGKMACEFESDSGLLDRGKVGIVPHDAVHLFDGLQDDSELLVVDITADDPFIVALEQSCGLTFQDTIFRQPEFVSLETTALPMLDFAAEQLAQSGNRNAPALNCQLVSFFLTQLCQLYSPTQRDALYRRRIDSRRLNRLIDQQISQGLTNAALAEQFNLSESYFYAIFQQQFGISPQKYVQARRLQQLRFQLLHSRKGLTTLAEELGFADASSLSRAFKRHFHCTPGQLRKQAGQ